MRILLYGRPAIVALAACAGLAQAAGATAAWRRDSLFVADQTEPADAVVCVEGTPNAEAIAAAYAANAVPVFVVPPDDFEDSPVAAEVEAFLADGTPLSAADRRARDAVIAELRTELEIAHGDYDRACKTIAAMHAAAVGEVRGPTRGVVEDVADLRTRYEEQAATIASHNEQLTAKDAVIAEQAAAIAALEAQLAAASTEPQGDAAPPTDATTPTAPATRTRSRSK